MRWYGAASVYQLLITMNNFSPIKYHNPLILPHLYAKLLEERWRFKIDAPSFDQVVL